MGWRFVTFLYSTWKFIVIWVLFVYLCWLCLFLRFEGFALTGFDWALLYNWSGHFGGLLISYIQVPL